MEADFEEGVASFTRNIYKEFEEGIRSKDRSEIKGRLWDVVVLTASDENQRAAYEKQLELKVERREIPAGVDYKVFADPVGPKIGCGGATMHVVSKLAELYGRSRLDQLYILLINAGGQSQRLPSASVLGKVFTLLPFGNPPWTVLELKLAAYLPLLCRMNPGYLHVASDTIEVFEIDNVAAGDWSDWNFMRPGLTALAHPSTVYIGTTHGVFVLEPRSKSGSAAKIEFRSCVKVLQKPSVDNMKQIKAIERMESGNEFVYTDSLFYFDHPFSVRLAEFYSEVFPLQCEIDGYGDFMQSIGKNATPDFASDTRNVLKVNEHLIPTRRRLYQCLHDSELSVIAVNASKFYHLGTVDEYLDGFDSDGELANYCGFKRSVFSHLSSASANNGCIMYSSLSGSFEVGNRSIVEYCLFSGSVVIGANSVVSNCSNVSSDGVIHIPANMFFHTFPVQFVRQSTKYVTLVFHVADNVKKTATGEVCDLRSSMKFLGKPLSDSVPVSIPDQELFSKDTSGDVVYSLWHTRLFLAADTMSESLSAAIHLANGSKLSSVNDETSRFLSAAEAVQQKDVNKMLAYRTELYNLLIC